MHDSYVISLSTSGTGVDIPIVRFTTIRSSTNGGSPENRDYHLRAIAYQMSESMELKS
jgi:hypothetical protein